LGDSRKYPYLYHGQLFLNSLGKGEFFELEIQRYGGTYDWNSEGMGEGISRF